jgi:hypothetical protein
MGTDRRRSARRRGFGLGLAVALLAFLALGCETIMDPLNMRGEFRETQQRFTQYVRWGNFARASEYVHPDQREQFLALAPELSEIRFTDYEIRDVRIGERAQDATADVLYTGYLMSGMIERHVGIRQEWQRGTDGWRVRMDLDRIRESLNDGRP